MTTPNWTTTAGEPNDISSNLNTSNMADRGDGWYREGDEIHTKVGEVFDAMYLVIVCIVGTVGNSMLIASIVHSRTVFKNGNVFIINLAVADLMVTGVLTPIIAANVIESSNVLSDQMCRAAGFLICTCCVISIHTLMAIAINRFWAVVYRSTFDKVFTVRHSLIMLTVIWIWSSLLVLPTVAGNWSTTVFDEIILLCTWDSTYSRSYTLTVMLAGCMLPMALTCVFYSVLFKNVRRHDKDLRRQTKQSNASRCKRHASQRRMLKREVALFKTLATSCTVFVVCWSPYVSYSVFTPHDVDPTFKMVVARMILSNSAVNFIIYGLMHKGYRDGYRHLLIHIWTLLHCRN